MTDVNILQDEEDAKKYLKLYAVDLPLNDNFPKQVLLYFIFTNIPKRYEVLKSLIQESEFVKYVNKKTLTNEEIALYLKERASKRSEFLGLTMRKSDSKHFDDNTYFETDVTRLLISPNVFRSTK